MEPEDPRKTFSIDVDDIHAHPFQQLSRLRLERRRFTVRNAQRC
jgi:hypothetical protein